MTRIEIPNTYVLPLLATLFFITFCSAEQSNFYHVKDDLQKTYSSDKETYSNSQRYWYIAIAVFVFLVFFCCRCMCRYASPFRDTNVQVPVPPPRRNPCSTGTLVHLPPSVPTAQLRNAPTYQTLSHTSHPAQLQGYQQPLIYPNNSQHQWCQQPQMNDPFQLPAQLQSYQHPSLNESLLDPPPPYTENNINGAYPTAPPQYKK